MGCGTSSNVVPIGEPHDGNGDSMNGATTVIHAKTSTNGYGNHSRTEVEDLPTVILPESVTEITKPPLAFEIPLTPDQTPVMKTPPPRIQRLLEQPAQEITLPDIEEKLQEAEKRREMILQHRVLSASKRVQKNMKAFLELSRNHMKEPFPEHEDHDVNKSEIHTQLRPPQEHFAWEERST